MSENRQFGVSRKFPAVLAWVLVFSIFIPAAAGQTAPLPGLPSSDTVNQLDPERISLTPVSEIYSGDPIDYSAYQPYDTRIATTGNTTWIEQIGNLKVIAESWGRLRFFDLSIPDQPEQVFEKQYDRITNLTSEGALVFVGATTGENDAFDLFNVDDPGNPQLLQSTHLNIDWYGGPEITLPALDCQIDNNSLFILGYTDLGKRAFWIFENHDGYFENTFTGQLPYYKIQSFVVENGLAYGCKVFDGITVYDVSDPTQAPSIRQLDVEGFYPEYALANQGYLYVSDKYGMLCIFDISGPSLQPQLISMTQMRVGGGPLKLGPNGLLYCCDTTVGLLQIDVSDPAQPEILGSYALPGGGGDLEFGTDNTMAVTTSDGVWFFSPEEFEHIIQPVVSGWNIRAGVAAGGLIYGGEGSDFQIYRPEPDGQVQLLGEVELTYAPSRIFTDNRIAVVDARRSVFGNLMEILDVSDPLNPSIMLTLPIENNSDRECDAEFVGDNIFLTKKGLRIIDTSLLANPEIIYEDLRDIYQIECQNDIGFILGSTECCPIDDFLEVVDLSDPQEVTTLATLDLEGFLGFLALYSDYLYVSQYFNGPHLTVVDVSDPTDPQVINTIAIGASISDMRIYGQTLYLGTYDGVKILDLADPANPAQVGHVLGSYIQQVSADEGILYQVSNYRLLTVPAHDGAALSGVDDDGFASEDEFIEPHDQLIPSALSIQVHPNPFNPRTTVKYALPAASSVDFRIFDLSGREVWALPSAVIMPAGNHQFHWMGKNSEGRNLPSGTYLLRMKAGSFQATEKLMLVR